MHDFKTFMCALILYNHNFNMIRWNAYGPDFSQIRFEGERCSSALSTILTWRCNEAISIVDFEFPSYEEVISVLSDANKNFLHFDETRRFTDLHEVHGLCYTMMKDLIECMDEFDDDSEENKFLNNVGKDIRDLYAQYKRMNIDSIEPEDNHDEDEPGYVDFGSNDDSEGDDLPDIDLDFEDEPENDSPDNDDNDLTDFGFPISED